MAKLSGQHCAILFAGYDLSGRSRQFEVGVEYEEEDGTAFQDGGENSQPGLPMVVGNFQSFLDPATGSSMDALQTPGGASEHVLMVLVGQGATPDEGDPGYAALCKQFTFNNAKTPRAKLVADITVHGVGYKPHYGEVMDYATVTNTKTGDTVDGGAANAAGGVGYLVVFTPTATDSYSIKIQDSTNGSTWADYITFAGTGQSRTTERVVETTQLERYRRALVTRTGTAGDSFGFAILLGES